MNKETKALNVGSMIAVLALSSVLFASATIGLLVDGIRLRSALSASERMVEIGDEFSALQSRITDSCLDLTPVIIPCGGCGPCGPCPSLPKKDQ